MRHILKADSPAGSVVLRTNTNIFTVGDERPPVMDLDARLLVGAEGALVPKFLDGSGNNFHAVQGTATRQAVLRKAAVNGHNAIETDGMDDFYESLTGWSPKTLFVVYRNMVANNGGTLLSGQSYDAFQSGGTNILFDANFNHYGTSTASRTFINGTKAATNGTVSKPQVWHLLTLDVVENIFVDALFARKRIPDSFFKLQITRMINYDYRMPDDQRKAVEAALIQLYAL